MSRERRYFYDVKCDGLVRISGDLFHCPCVVTVPDLTEMPEGWEFIEGPVMHFCPLCASAARKVER